MLRVQCDGVGGICTASAQERGVGKNWVYGQRKSWIEVTDSKTNLVIRGKNEFRPDWAVAASARLKSNGTMQAELGGSDLGDQVAGRVDRQLIRTAQTKADAPGISAWSEIEIEFQAGRITVKDQVGSRIDGRVTDTCEVWNASQLPVGAVAQEVVAPVGL